MPKAENITPRPFEKHYAVASGLLPPLDHALIDTLTRKQRVVLSMMGSGLNLFQISAVLRRSYSSVAEMRRDLMVKLKVQNVEQAVRLAVEAGLVIQRECGAWVEPAWVSKIRPIGGDLIRAADTPAQPAPRAGT